MGMFDDLIPGAAPAAPQRLGLFDDLIPGAAPAAPTIEPRSRFGLNVEEGFRGTLVGDAIERTRSGQVATFAGDAAVRAADEAATAGSAFGLEQSGGAPSPYAGIPVQRLREMGQQAQATGAQRMQVFQTETLPQRQAEAATVQPWNQGNIIDRAAAGAAALAGQVIGSMGSPESFVGPAGARIARQGAEGVLGYIGRQAVESGAPNAAVAGAVDPLVQTGQIGRGERQDYSPADTAFAAALGGLIGTTVPVSIGAARAARDVLAARRGVAPEQIAPEEVAAAWRDPEVQRAAEATGITDPADPRVPVLTERLDANRAAETQRAAVAPSVTEADLRAGREAVDSGVNPAFVEPPPRTAPPDVIALPQDPSGPPLRGTPDPNAIGIEPAVQRYGNAGDPAVAYDARRAEMERQQWEAESAALRDAQARQQALDLQAYQSVRPQEPPSAGPPPEAPSAPPVPAPRGDVPAVRDQPALGRSDGAAGAAQGPAGGGVAGARGGVAAPASRAQQQIARLTRNGEPAPGTPAAAQLARLRAQVPPAEGAPRVADPQPASPDPAARPPEATTTPRPTSADVAPAPVAEQFSGGARPGVPRASAPDDGGAMAAADASAGPRGRDPAPPPEPPARPADAPEQAGSARRPGGASPPDAPAPGRPFTEQAPNKPRVGSEYRPNKPDARYASADGQKRLMAEAAGLSAVDKIGARVNTRAPGDYGADPVGDGRFRMVPSGDIVDFAERNGRLDSKRAGDGVVFSRGADAPDGPRTGPDLPAGAPDLYSGIPLSPENIRRFLADPAMAAARRLKQTLLSSTGARAVGDTTRFFLASNRAALRTFVDRYPNIPELKKLVDDIATDPGAGRNVGGETFQTAADNTAMSYTNRVTNMLGKTPDEAADARVRDILTGNARPRDAAEAAKAQRVRGLLDEFYDYTDKAFRQAAANRAKALEERAKTARGEDLAGIRQAIAEARKEANTPGSTFGYVKGKYFPRLYDAEKALANSEGFLRDAATLYRKMGLDAADSREAAQDWLNRLAGVGRGPNEFGHSAVGGGRFTKTRELPADADRIMREWMVTDPREVLHGYFLRGAKAAEYTRRFGKNGERIEETLTAAFQKGMAPRDIDFFRRHVESSLGTMGGVASGPGHALSGWIQTIGPLAVLPRAALSSIVEGMTIGARTGNLWRGIEGFGESWKAVARRPSTAEARQTAELLGIISDGFADMRAAAMWDAGVNSKAQRALVGGMFRVTGLHEMTNGQRVAATKIGQVWIRQLLDEVIGGAPTQASAKRLLSELGIDEAQAKPLKAWLARNDGVLKQTDLLGGAPEAALYRTAVRRFVNESVQNPEAVDKPALAGHHVGRMAYGITSFMFAFTRNVVLRSLKEAKEATSGSGYTAQDRLRMVGPWVAFAALGAAQFGVSQVREAMFNWHQNDTRDPWVKSILNLDRAGAFGTFSPLVNMISAAKYDRDPSSVLTGPYLAHFMTNLGKMTLGLVPQPVGPNSPRTNNAEHTAVRAFHASVMAPVISAAAAMAPGGAAMQAAYGLGTMFATSRGAGQELANTVVGQPTVKPRTPGQSSRGSQVRR